MNLLNSLILLSTHTHQIFYKIVNELHQVATITDKQISETSVAMTEKAFRALNSLSLHKS